MFNKSSVFHPYNHRLREYGNSNYIGAGDAMAKSIYTAMAPRESWHFEKDCIMPTGGIFNLEFSPDGSLLVAACEKKCFQIFDPLNYKRIHTVDAAHHDCVNCVKFLDDRVFATCSDDTTINLWDVRNLQTKIMTLSGHSSWVKSIEFSSKDKLLVTCGLDGSIYTWDVNSYAENRLLYSRIFNAPDLMRCRLSPDSSQMVMCTTGGLIIIVHNLDLPSLKRDLSGFKPNIFRLMQTAHQNFPVAKDYIGLFHKDRSKNRLEFISDFPNENDAAVVSSLQVHPQGWTALSRNISHDDKSEWTCVHNIQSEPDSESSEDEADETQTDSEGMEPKRKRRRRQLLPEPENDELSTHFNVLVPRPTQGQESIQSVQTDVWEAWVTLRQARILQAVVNRGQTVRSFNMQHITGINTGITNLSPDVEQAQDLIATNTNRPSTSGHTANVQVEAEITGPQQEIRQNKERLLYYIEETNEGKGFIKELCYSSDGRIICSPYGYGIRLLTHNKDCMELPQCVEEVNFKPKELLELGSCMGVHRDLVVSAKFNPRHYQLVTGCLAGKIVWYVPNCL